MTDQYLRDLLRKYVESFLPYEVYPIPTVFTAGQEALLNKMVSNIQMIIQEEVELATKELKEKAWKYDELNK